MRSNPGIRLRCDELRAAQKAMEDRFLATKEGRKEVDRAYVRGTLQEIAERCMTAEPVLIKGIPSGTYSFDAAGATRAVELLGKDLGMFVERKEIGAPGSFANEAERKEARARITAKLAKLGIVRVIGSGSMVGKAEGSEAAPVAAKTVSDGISTPVPVPEIPRGSDLEPRETDELPTIEPPDQTVDISTADDHHIVYEPAPIPPGILDAPARESGDRMKPIIRPPADCAPIPQPKQKVELPPLVDPGPGPDRQAYRKELRRRLNLDVRFGTPNTRTANGHLIKRDE